MRWLVLFASVAIFAAVVLIGIRLAKGHSVTATKEVASFEDVLDPSTGKVPLKVFSVEKESTGLFDAQDIRTTRIDLGGSAPETLTLPFETDLAAHAATTADLDHNEVKEVLLYKDDFTVAVVSLRNRKLTFRPTIDVLKSWAFDVHPHDAGTGHLVFVSASIFPVDGTARVPRPRLFSWTEEGGFSDVTSQYPDYVEAHLIPALAKDLTSEHDQERKENYQRVITELTNLKRKD